MQSKKAVPLAHHVYLVRHGKVDLAADICYGQLDCGVAPTFDSELHRLTDYFDQRLGVSPVKNKVTNVPHIITSPLLRCQQLAEGLNQHFVEQHELPTLLESIDGFKEISFGEWEGKSWEQIGQSNIEAWNDNFVDYTFPNGESTNSFHRRVVLTWHSLLTELAKKEEEQTVIIVTHAGVIRSILTCFLEMPLKHSLSLNIDKVSVSNLKVVPQQRASSRCLGINYTL